MRIRRIYLILLPILLITICLAPGQAIAPELPIKQSVPVVSSHANPISRGEEPRVEKRIMRITAYTKNDRSMDGKGITANGERVLEGRTIAAPKEIPLGSEIYIPALNHSYIVTDRGGAIHGNRLDLYMEKRKDALDFGVQYLEVWIKR